MVKKIILLLVYISVLVLESCGGGNTRESSARYQIKYYAKEFGNCDSISNYCVSIKINYPLFTATDEAFVKDSLNNKISKMILQPVFELKSNSLDELADSLIYDYKKVKKEFPDSPITYTLERSVDVILNKGSIISLVFNEYSFMGGAHPNSLTVFNNINLQTGKNITLNELLNDGFERELNLICEKKFREVRELKPEDNLEESGFWFKDNKFLLTQNYSITQKGLKFFFNDYEVAPHAVGPTEIIILYDELINMINPKGLLSSLLK